MEHKEHSDSQTMLFITATVLAFNALLLPVIGAYLKPLQEKEVTYL